MNLDDLFEKQIPEVHKYPQRVSSLADSAISPSSARPGDLSQSSSNTILEDREEGGGGGGVGGSEEEEEEE